MGHRPSGGDVPHGSEALPKPDIPDSVQLFAKQLLELPVLEELPAFAGNPEELDPKILDSVAKAAFLGYEERNSDQENPDTDEALDSARAYLGLGDENKTVEPMGLMDAKKMHGTSPLVPLRHAEGFFRSNPGSLQKIINEALSSSETPSPSPEQPASSSQPSTPESPVLPQEEKPYAEAEPPPTDADAEKPTLTEPSETLPTPPEPPVAHDSRNQSDARPEDQAPKLNKPPNTPAKERDPPPPAAKPPNTDPRPQTEEKPELYSPTPRPTFPPQGNQNRAVLEDPDTVSAAEPGIQQVSKVSPVPESPKNLDIIVGPESDHLASITRDFHELGIEPRPYQIDCVKTLEDDEKKGEQELWIEMATGLGKGVIIAVLAHRGLKERPTEPIAILADRETVMKQNLYTLQKLLGDELTYGEYSSRSKNIQHVTGFMLQSMRIPPLFPPGTYGSVFIDEAHHIPASSYAPVLEKHFSGYGRVVATTATPERNDRRDLQAFFGRRNFHMGLSEGIDGEWLANPHYYLSTDDVAMRRLTRDPQKDHAFMEAMHDVITNENVPDPRILVFAANQAHADYLAGIANTYFPGATSYHDRNPSGLVPFDRGLTRLVVGVDKLTEGFDRQRINVIGLFRYTAFIGRLKQMIGRATRRDDVKQDFWVFDAAGNLETMMQDKEFLRVVTSKTNKSSDHNMRPSSGVEHHQDQDYHPNEGTPVEFRAFDGDALEQLRKVEKSELLPADVRLATLVNQLHAEFGAKKGKIARLINSLGVVHSQPYGNGRSMRTVSPEGQETVRQHLQDLVDRYGESTVRTRL